MGSPQEKHASGMFLSLVAQALVSWLEFMSFTAWFPPSKEKGCLYKRNRCKYVLCDQGPGMHLKKKHLSGWVSEQEHVKERQPSGPEAALRRHKTGHMLWPKKTVQKKP
jgi:hypothetical protein